MIKNIFNQGSVEWCKEDWFCTFARSRNSTSARISLTGDQSKDEYNLLVKNASIIDETKYQCQVTATEKWPAIKSDWAFVQVLGTQFILICIFYNFLKFSS